MKKGVAVIFCMIFVFSFLCFPVFASESGAEEFVITLTSEENVDLSGIEVDVYKQINRVQIADNIMSFDQEYAGTAISDKNGVIRFRKPSEYYIFYFNMETLPTNMGMERGWLQCTAMDGSAEFTLHEISSVEAFLSGDKPVLRCMNDEDVYLVTNQQVVSHAIWAVPQVADSSIEEIIDENLELSVTLRHFGEISVNGTLYSYSLDKEYKDIARLEYISLLFDQGLITLERKIEMLRIVLESELTKYYWCYDEKEAAQEILERELENLSIQRRAEKQSLLLATAPAFNVVGCEELAAANLTEGLAREAVSGRVLDRDLQRCRWVLRYLFFVRW